CIDAEPSSARPQRAPSTSGSMRMVATTWTEPLGWGRTLTSPKGSTGWLIWDTRGPSQEMRGLFMMNQRGAERQEETHQRCLVQTGCRAAPALPVRQPRGEARAPLQDGPRRLAQVRNPPAPWCAEDCSNW